VIEAHGIGLAIGRKRLLDSVSLALAPGRVTILLGPNGAGKSTLIALLAAERRPTDGRLVIDGRPAEAWSVAALARRRAVLPQAATLAFGFTVAEVVTLGRLPFAGTADAADDAEAIAAARQRAAVAPLWPRAYATLSGGEQQRVQLARVLAQLWRPPAAAAPRTLLLDEPTAALDLQHRAVVVTLLRELAEAGIGVLAALHDLNLAAALADDVVLLRGGRVVAAGPREAVLAREPLGACFGVPIEILPRPGGGVAFVA
jgi:iron complex transport system ATP-binding protein